jgi:phage shock protein A
VEAAVGAVGVNLHGMDKAAALEYIGGCLSTLKLTEQKITALAADQAKWNGRIKLAGQNGRADLAQQAQAESDRIAAQKTALEAEAAALRSDIDGMKRQLPTLGAYLRSVDPDLLEQELLIARGLNPGDEEAAAADSAFNQMDKEAGVQDALAALKARMGKDGA